jgi:hypothetical protein
MSWWKLAYWLIGTLGVAGTIALLVFFPAVFSIAFKAVVRFFSLVLSYRVGCAVVAAIAAALIADYHRHSIDDADFAARSAAFEQAQVDRDERIRQETRENVWKEIANATAENAKTDENVKVFTDALPTPSAAGNPFAISDADAIRLCHIAGQTECGPRRDKGVSKIRRASRRAADQKIRLPSLIRNGAWSDQKGQ